jgi:DNA repair exonuclease SbcCD nuclease subunit
VLVVHTSDLHLGSEIHDGEGAGPDGLAPLRAVLAAAQQADLLLVVGDMFDNNRLGAPLLEAAAILLAETPMQVVILPGNHDPLTPDSVYRRGPFATVPNVAVLGLASAEDSCQESAIFPRWGLEVFGRAHRGYGDMPPLAAPPPRTTRWQIALAHGHFEETGPEDHRWRPSWRFRREDLAAVTADYIALGHWERAAPVGGRLRERTVRAYYSGSPATAGTVNLIRLSGDGRVRVTRRPIGCEIAER